MNYKFFTAVAVLLCFTSAINAQQRSWPREKISVNSNWGFHQGELTSPFEIDESVWKVISLPHTWNVDDAKDEQTGFFQGESWYHKELYINSDWKNKEIFLYFEGANQETEVYVNGKKAGAHTGGYTRFAVPIRSFVQFPAEGSATADIQIKVNNRHSEDIPPLDADFTFFGGIYRDVYLVATGKVHFNLQQFASSAIRISTPQVSEKSAHVNFISSLVNDSGDKKQVKLTQRILDADKKLIKEVTQKISLKAGEQLEVAQSIDDFANPHLWSIEDPYLYEVVTEISDAKSGEVLDKVSNPLGIRWFRFDAGEGFFLNGKHVKLIGTNRHQDYKGIGNALPDAVHISDIKLLKQMGGNFLRISHYPQDPTILEMCDKLGIVTSVEIPIVNRVTASQAFISNSQHMMREMIRQNYNHPSVVIWAYMNEVLLVPRYSDNSPERETYYQEIVRQAQAIEDLVRAEDPIRYTMIPNHGWFEGYNNLGLTKIPKIVGWNLYQGWYGADITGFEKFLEKHHHLLPDKPVIITEYGAGADPRLHSFQPQRFDFTVEYQTLYHKHYAKQIMDLPFVAGANIWNLNDFYSEGRRDAVPHVNSKGIATLTREPKDAYYFYQAVLLDQPFVGIGSKLWKYRAGVEESAGSGICYQPLEVYSNLEKIKLVVNGGDLGSQNVREHTATWQVPFREGKNAIEAIGESNGEIVKDFVEINFSLIPYQLNSKSTPFETIRISVGSHRYFVDDLTHEVWLPDRPYKKGQWGVKNNDAVEKETPSDIFGTGNDPIFQTQLSGLRDYQLDVPPGTYVVTLHFAELLSSEELEKLAYNLGQEQQQEKASKRVFTVYVNTIPLIEDLNLAEQYGEKRAVSFKTEVHVNDDEGISLKFDASEGAPVLNGLEVRKIY